MRGPSTWTCYLEGAGTQQKNDVENEKKKIDFLILKFALIKGKGTTYSCLLNSHLNLGDVARLKLDCQHVYALKEYIVPDVNEDILFYAYISSYPKTHL